MWRRQTDEKVYLRKNGIANFVDILNKLFVDAADLERMHPTCCSGSVFRLLQGRWTSDDSPTKTLQITFASPRIASLFGLKNGRDRQHADTNEKRVLVILQKSKYPLASFHSPMIFSRLSYLNLFYQIFPFLFQSVRTRKRTIITYHLFTILTGIHLLLLFMYRTGPP